MFKWSRTIQSFLKQTFFCLFIMLHNQSVSHSQLSPVLIAHHNAASWASCCWWVCIISRSTTSTPMDEEGTPTAHITLSLGLEVEGARSLNWRIMHGVLAVTNFVCGGWKGSYHLGALFVRVIETSSWPWIAGSINGIVSWSTSETAWFLVIVVGLWRSRWERVTATLGARLIACLKLAKSSGEFQYFLGSSKWWEGLSERTAQQ